MKAWLFLFDFDGPRSVWDCLWADTRGQAKALAAAVMGMDFLEVRVRREAKFDALPGHVTSKNWLEAGYTVECSRCSGIVYPDEVEYDHEGEPLCEEHAEEYAFAMPVVAWVLARA